MPAPQGRIFEPGGDDFEFHWTKSGCLFVRPLGQVYADQDDGWHFVTFDEAIEAARRGTALGALIARRGGISFA
jgi:hypothetical protein